MAISDVMKKFLKSFGKVPFRGDYRRCARPGCGRRFKPPEVPKGLTREDVDRDKGFPTGVYCSEKCSSPSLKLPPRWGRKEQTPRQAQRYAMRKLIQAEIKEKHGCGTHSFAEGVTRKSARNIARQLFRQRWRNRVSAQAGA